MNKKYFLTFGAITATVSPIVAVVSCGDEETTPPENPQQNILKDIAGMFEGKKLTKTYQIAEQVDYADTALTWEKMQEKLDAWCGENPIDLGDKQDGIEFNFKIPEKIEFAKGEKEITIKIIKGTEEQEVTIKVTAAADKNEADSQAIKYVASKLNSLSITNIELAADIAQNTSFQSLSQAVWDNWTKSGTMSKKFDFSRLYGTALTYSVPNAISTGNQGNINVKIKKDGGVEATEVVSLTLATPVTITPDQAKALVDENTGAVTNDTQANHVTVAIKDGATGNEALASATAGTAKNVVYTITAEEGYTLLGSQVATGEITVEITKMTAVLFKADLEGVFADDQKSTKNKTDLETLISQLTASDLDELKAKLGININDLKIPSNLSLSWTLSGGDQGGSAGRKYNLIITISDSIDSTSDTVSRTFKSNDWSA